MSPSAAPAGSVRGVRLLVTRGSRPQLWLTTLARVALGVVLLVAGWLKISSPDDAVRAVQAYQLLPQGLTHAFGYGLPMLEMALGVLLVLGLGTRWAAVGAGLLMVVFIAAIISVWVRGLSIDCGCFGGGGTITPEGRSGRYSAEIGRDLLFLGLASWVAVFPHSRLSLDGLFGRADDVPGPDRMDDLDRYADHDAADEPIDEEHHA